MRIQKGQSVRPSLGRGTHEVTIQEIIPEFDVDTFYGPKDLFQIRFTKGRSSITQKYIAYYDESSEFGKLVHAALGELPEDFDTNKLIGKSCRITVSPKISKQNKTYLNVVKVEPSERQSDHDKAMDLFAE